MTRTTPEDHMKPAFTKKHYEKLAEFFAYELRIALDIQGARVFPKIGRAHV